MRFFRWLSAHFATPRLLLEIAAVAAALYGIDQFLASLELREQTAEARRDFDQAEALLRQGRAAEAIERFRHAHIEDRENRTYALGLADAYLTNHQPDRAEAGLEELLAADSNDGQANLRMARVMSQQGDATRADSYYHRAIYGVWRAQASADRTAARLELVQWLAGRHQNQELLSELLLLDRSARTDPNLQAQLPALYLQAGEPERAEASYRALLKSAPHDAAAYAGLGEVELSRGNFRGAHEAFDHADRLQPGNPALQKKARLAARAFELDPTPRHLSSSERLSRGESILDIAVAAAQNCTTVEPAVLQSAAALLKQRAASKPSESGDGSEKRLASAEGIWHELQPSCASPDDAALLAVLMHKLAQ